MWPRAVQQAQRPQTWMQLQPGARLHAARDVVRETVHDDRPGLVDACLRVAQQWRKRRPLEQA
eukprot:11076725-Lingulodinium_polyedra.AAC.1